MAMVEYRDGNFGDMVPLDVHREFMNMWADKEDEFFKTVKATHFGTFEELEEVKEKADMQTQIDRLEERLEEIDKPKSNYIILPSHEDVMRFTKEEVKSIL